MNRCDALVFRGDLLRLYTPIERIDHPLLSQVNRQQKSRHYANVRTTATLSVFNS